MKRRDITLGELQDECNRAKGLCIGGCKFIDVCPNRCDVETRPSKWDLSDPPRFNEAQMALLKALRGLDFVSIENLGSGAFQTKSKDGKTGLFMKLLGIEDGETIDLAELLGKDGAE